MEGRKARMFLGGIEIKGMTSYKISSIPWWRKTYLDMVEKDYSEYLYKGVPVPKEEYDQLTKNKESE